MPGVEVNVRGAKYRLDFPTEPTEAEIEAAVQGITGEVPEPPRAVAADGTSYPILATAARVAFPIGGAVAGALSPLPGGTYLGGAAGGAAGEAVAQWLGGGDLDAREIALQGGLGAIPFAGKAATPLKGVVLRGVQGAALGGGSSAIRDVLHGRDIDLTGVLRGGGIGGVAGGALGGLEGTLARRATLANLRLEQPDVPAAALPAPAPDLPAVPTTTLRPAAPAPFAWPGAAPDDATSLGQMGLPGRLGMGEAREVGALSAADPGDLAPSIIHNVETTDDVKALVDNLAARNSSMIEDARRGVQTTAQREAAARPIIADLAERVGTSPKAFVENLRRRGEAVNAEQMAALKTVFTSVTGDFYDVAKRVAAGDSDPQTLLQMAKAMNLAKGVLAQKAGATAEAGRALNALRGTQQMDRLQGKALEALLSKAGTSEDALQNIATRAATLDMTDPTALTRFLREAAEATTADKIHEAWVNGLLSGPRTHIVNNVSNALALGLRLPEEMLSGSLDALRAGVTGGPRERFAGEAVADVLGISRGLIGGARAALRAFRTEVPQFGTQRIEGNPFAIKGSVGSTVRLPSRLLLAADEFWKTAGAEGAAYAQAYREAAQDGFAGTERMARMADLLSTDRGRLLDAARPEALYRTFQTESPLAMSIIGARNAIPGARYVLPFVRTPVNVASFGLERTPFGVGFLASKAWKGASAGELADSAARVALGTGLAGATVALVAGDRITGSGPSDRSEMQALKSTGWQPYSVRIGDTFYAYNRLEPVGAVLGFAADAAEAMRDPLVDGEEVAAQMGFAFAKRLTDQTFLSGLQDALDALDDPKRFGARYVQRMAASFIPTGLAQMAGALDPTVRDTTTFGNLVQSRIPGMSDDLPPIRNIWGEPVNRGNEGLAALLSPMATTERQNDPASVEVRRLVEATGFGVGSPARSLTSQGQTEKLTPEEYDRFAEQAGQLAKTLVTRLVTAPNYQRIASDEKRARLITNTVGQARDVARDQLKLRRRMTQGGAPLPLAVP